MAQANAPGTISAPSCPADGAVKLTMLLTVAVLLLMMAFGLTMRMAQGALIQIDPTIFYRLMTAHGIGMVGIAGMSGSAIMWYFLSRHVSLAGWVFWIHLGLFVVGVVAILGSIFIGGYAGAWTFLFPLPAISGGVWDVGAAATYLIGVILVGVGFLVYLVEVGRAVIERYGNFANALGWPLLFSGKQDDVPPPTVIAAAAIVVFNGISTVVGAAVLIISLINLYLPSFTLDALLAKNMIYFFGHVFINASIYMAVIAVYEIVPEYTQQQWKVSRSFVASWNAVVFLVMAVYTHHLFQDGVMPAWALVMGQIISYASGIPLLVITTFSLLTYLYRSGIRWDLASALLVTGIFGWSIGAVPAIIDGMISVNNIMHNTQWVPGHFHLYLLLGQVALTLGFSAWLTRTGVHASLSGWNARGFTIYLLGGMGFAIVFLVSGASSIPRRWATHLPEWHLQDQVGSLFALAAILGVGIIVLPITKRLVLSMRG
ncbi:cbb3-type cytochrome c oxidase subunit I [Bradyrhizobium sp. AUGA SZCCT0176]|uniref:cbb3-type cytochrome c oxidase subunit I n=1 Tax=Bradyrhizobium sp. AUGA SZCCT0176 TaxID=2807664 RepID=UPI001BA5F694|nr:cbb3-type cytochrome c oxidase subunit I [Bradyrhizobium sp. AUGA SZCCT0176]MBR1225123.1 cbb3-type cytochrome c oxidase subunit I [Bradyrhizobium sp. AUGA SZCCT0176]